MSMIQANSILHLSLDGVITLKDAISSRSYVLLVYFYRFRASQKDDS